jgi:hypothetical protein
VAGFRSEKAILNIHDFEDWLGDNEKQLQARVASWIPDELSDEDRSVLLSQLKSDCIAAIKAAIEVLPEEEPKYKNSEESDASGEDAPEEDEEKPVQTPNSGHYLIDCSIGASSRAMRSRPM